MIRNKAGFLVMKNSDRRIKVAFNGIEKLTEENSGLLKKYLTDLVTKPGTRLEIDLTGIRFIDNTGFDMLNLIERVGRKYGSVVVLQGVGDEVYEMIQLLKKYSVFQIQSIQTTI